MCSEVQAKRTKFISLAIGIPRWTRMERKGKRNPAQGLATWKTKDSVLGANHGRIDISSAIGNVTQNRHRCPTHTNHLVRTVRSHPSQHLEQTLSSFLPPVHKGTSYPVYEGPGWPSQLEREIEGMPRKTLTCSQEHGS